MKKINDRICVLLVLFLITTNFVFANPIESSENNIQGVFNDLSNFLNDKIIYSIYKKKSYEDYLIEYNLSVINLDDKYKTIVYTSLEQINKPYSYSASGPDMYDCSGFTYYIYDKMKIKIPRTSMEQSQGGIPVDLEDIKVGDLIFFDTRDIETEESVSDFIVNEQNNDQYYANIIIDNELDLISFEDKLDKRFVPEKVTHVGLYLGNNKFIHASSGANRVIVSELTSGYYNKRFIKVKRYN